MNEKKRQTKMIKSLDAVIEQQKDCLEYYFYLRIRLNLKTILIFQIIRTNTVV